MPRLAVANDDQVDAIYRESWSVWGAGLGYEDYVGLWQELSRTPWGQRCVRFHVWVDGDRILSSMKVYRPRLRLLGRARRVAVIGAVFTPAAFRRRGHAQAMLRAAIDDAARRGEELVLLFSDIGTDYYMNLGFRPLPAEEQCGRLPRSTGRTHFDLSLRPMQPEDLGPIASAHDEFCRQRPIALLRDLEHWRYLAVRSRSFFDRLGDPGASCSWRIATLRGRFAGYVITVQGRGDWNIREVGAVRGDPEVMAAIVRLAAADARRCGFRAFYGWLARDVTSRLGDWKIRNRRRDRPIPMILGLDGADSPADLVLPETPDAAYLPFLDQF